MQDTEPLRTRESLGLEPFPVIGSPPTDVRYFPRTQIFINNVSSVQREKGVHPGQTSHQAFPVAQQYWPWAAVLGRRAARERESWGCQGAGVLMWYRWCLLCLQ